MAKHYGNPEAFEEQVTALLDTECDKLFRRLESTLEGVAHCRDNENPFSDCDLLVGDIRDLTALLRTLICAQAHRQPLFEEKIADRHRERDARFRQNHGITRAEVP